MPETLPTELTDSEAAPGQPAQPDGLLDLKLQYAQERIVELTQQLERALCDIADWKEQAKRIALVAPAPASAPTVPQRAWWRVRAF
jgi:hypothetical protein